MPQVGFGWTNGVVLDLLTKFPVLNLRNGDVTFSKCVSFSV